MEIKNIVMFENWKSKNDDENGKAILRFAERWALLMESHIDNRANFHEIVKKTSHEADTEEITGSMYVAAVYLLSHCWQYGEALRRWHSGAYNYYKLV